MASLPLCANGRVPVAGVIARIPPQNKYHGRPALVPALTRIVPAFFDFQPETLPSALLCPKKKTPPGSGVLMSDMLTQVLAVS